MSIEDTTCNPFVSVYIATFNRCDLLRRAVNSVLNQSYKNFEIIIGDDGSTDNTKDYLRELANSHKNISVIISNENNGANKTRNLCINAAVGELITGLDDDDYFLEDRLASLVEAWKNKSSNIVAICSNLVVPNSKGKFNITNKPRFIVAEDLIHSNYIGNQVLTKRSFIVNIGAYDESFSAWQDLDLWYRLLRSTRGKVYCVKKATYVYDTTHAHERISSGRLEKINEAANMFSAKHMLNKRQNLVLNLQLSLYTDKNFSIVAAIKKFLVRPTPRIFFHSMRIILKSLRSRI